MQKITGYKDYEDAKILAAVDLVAEFFGWTAQHPLTKIQFFRTKVDEWTEEKLKRIRREIAVKEARENTTTSGL